MAHFAKLPKSEYYNERFAGQIQKDLTRTNEIRQCTEIQDLKAIVGEYEVEVLERKERKHLAISLAFGVPVTCLSLMMDQLCDTEAQGISCHTPIEENRRELRLRDGSHIWHPASFNTTITWQ